MPSQSAVLSAIGPDRPGLVDQIAAVIHGAGGNIADSRMTILGGEFALILLFSGSAPALAKIKKNMGPAAKRLKLAWTLQTTSAGTRSKPFIPYRLRVTGLDHPGIVHRVTSAVAKLGVNVASLDTDLTPAPISGAPLFVLSADLQVPVDLAAAELRKALDLVCEVETLDFTLEVKA